MSNNVKVKKFSTILRNRNKHQTDGANTGIEFRERYLKELYDQKWWNDDQKTITLDFDEVVTLGPSWANEVFAFFCTLKGVDSKKIFTKIKMKNISPVKKETIKMEVDDGYKGL